MLTRVLVEIFSRDELRSLLAFRGGTALHKLYFDPPGRYSEDIDLVQIQAGPIGPVLSCLRAALDPWLGEPSRTRGADSVRLVYRFETTSMPVQSMRVKIEINTREHFSVYGLEHVSFGLGSPWHSAVADITTYRLEELLATKLRALYQRRKGRDLCDLWLGLSTRDLDTSSLVDCFSAYLGHSGLRISRSEFEANLAEKLLSKAFRTDVVPLLRDSVAYDVDAAAEMVRHRLISLLPRR